MMFLRHTYGGHGPCARYAFRKRTSQRVGCSARLARASIQPDDDDGAAPGARSPARDDAPAPRPCMHAAAARVPPPAQHSTAQHETGSGACTPVWWWWWWRALSCRSFPRLHRSRERPRPAFRKGAHNARTGRALGKRRAQTQLGPRSVSAGLGWGGLGDDERRLSLRWLARAQCQWTGGAARARPRRVGVGDGHGRWATAQARRQVTSWSRSRGPYVGPPGRLLFTPYIYTSFL